MPIDEKALSKGYDAVSHILAFGEYRAAVRSYEAAMEPIPVVKASGTAGRVHLPEPETQQPVDWTEDATHENGNYQCRCIQCGVGFIGHKRRVVCKKCSQPVEETAPELLQRLGDDASKWASEFRKKAIKLGYSDMDEGWLIGWFANAIEHSTDIRRKKRG